MQNNDTKFSVTDPRGITVTCSKERWDTHVVAGHEIMEKNVEAVKETIKFPEIICKTSHPEDDRNVYFKKAASSSYDAYTKVIVALNKGKKDPEKVVGEVVTAFPQKEIKGGIGDAVYPES